jgi:type III secretion system YscD/HrpQ family protein
MDAKEVESKEDTLFDEEAPAGKDALAEINFELVETGRWLLKVIGGPNNGAEFSMQPGNSYVIGTDPNSCDIVFHDTSVSRQHARISVTKDEQLYIEDLSSRNGTLLDGESLKAKKLLPPNIVVTLGTTSFIVYDREGEMQTIISPLLPSIVKVLQKEEARGEEERGSQRELAEARASEAVAEALRKPEKRPISHLILITIIAAILAVAAFEVVSLFKSEPVVQSEQVDTNLLLNEALAPFPSVKHIFSKTTGRLLLVGHVLTATDKTQLLYNLQGLKFISSIDDSGVIIDEYVWQEMNQLLANNPNWRGITIQATSPGHFVMTGYLQTRKQAEQLSQYLSENFRYLDLLEKKLVVSEDVIAQVSTTLQKVGLRNLTVSLSNGELTINGNVPNNKSQEFQKLLSEIRAVPGVRLVKNYVTELPPEATFVNISDKYTVTGHSNIGGSNLTVVINGRILSQGDQLDGMTITKILPNKIQLEKEGVKYEIDYSK